MLVMTVPAGAQWKPDEFMILLGWVNGVQCPDDDSLAEAISDTGFNVVMWNRDKIDICRKYGLKVMILDADPETASGLSDSRTVWGYYIADEPYPEDKFPGLANKVMSFRRADPNHVPYINMLSNTGSFQVNRYFQRPMKDFNIEFGK